MVRLTCPTCGKPRLCRASRIMVANLEASPEPLSAREILNGTMVNYGSWKAVSHRLRAELASLNFQLVNVAGLGPWPARYRLQQREEA